MVVYQSRVSTDQVAGFDILNEEGNRTRRHGEAADGHLRALARLLPAAPLSVAFAVKGEET